MPNIASLLKNEISRVARKEIRAEMAAVKKGVTSHRSEIAALKRRIEALERELRAVRKSAGKAAPAAAAAAAAAAAEDGESGGRALRFSAKGLASQRKRLGLSAHDCGLLLGASGQSVYNWEDGKARPRVRHLAAIAGLRTMGKKEAAARLAALQSPAG